MTFDFSSVDGYVRVISVIDNTFPHLQALYRTYITFDIYLHLVDMI